MLAFRRAPGDADVVHYQWLTLPGLDRRLLPPTRPRVMTAHYILPPDASRRAARSARKVFGAMDAVVAHSEHGAARLRDEVGLPAERVRVIPHGAFDYLTRLPEEKPLPEELRGRRGAGRPLLRPAASLQGPGEPARGVRRGRGRRRAVDRRQPADVGRAAARDGGADRRQGPLRHPLRRGRRDPGDLPPRRRRRAALPRRRALRRPLHRPRLRQAAGGERGRRLPRGRRDRRRAARPARRHRRARRARCAS